MIIPGKETLIKYRKLLHGERPPDTFVNLDLECPPPISSIIAKLVARCIRMRPKRGIIKLRSIIRKAKQATAI